MPVVAGQQIKIRVGGWQCDKGEGLLTVTCEPGELTMRGPAAALTRSDLVYLKVEVPDFNALLNEPDRQPGIQLVPIARFDLAGSNIDAQLTQFIEITAPESIARFATGRPVSTRLDTTSDAAPPAALASTVRQMAAPTSARVRKVP